ncbi:MAG: hypothetical protein P4L69_05490 [Desulfosporosinus sp.]|nr:hypothetical protein [Desulfosporosinus sp.]
MLHGHVHGHSTWEKLATIHGGVDLSVNILDDFSERDLELIAPDVIVLSDVAGAPYQFSDIEIQALRNYILNNPDKVTHLLGTYALFYHDELSVRPEKEEYFRKNKDQQRIYDNRRLLPLFGLDERQSYAAVRTPPSLELLIPKTTCDCIRRNCALTDYHIRNFQFSQAPTAGFANNWLSDEGDAIHPALLDKPDTRIEVLAHSFCGESVIFRHVAPTHTAIYFSHMPEYRSGEQGRQLLYNAIVYLMTQGSPVRSLASLCVTGIAKRVAENDPHQKIAKQLQFMPMDLQERIANVLRLKYHYGSKGLLRLFRQTMT